MEFLSVISHTILFVKNLRVLNFVGKISHIVQSQQYNLWVQNYSFTTTL